MQTSLKNWFHEDLCSSKVLGCINSRGRINTAVRIGYRSDITGVL